MLLTTTTIIKTQLAQIGVKVPIEVLDRPLFLRRLTTDRDWHQIVNLTLSSPRCLFALIHHGHAGAQSTQLNHKDPKIDALWDQLKAATTAAEWCRLSREVQRYVVGNMVRISARALPFIQAARDHVKRYAYERGFKIRFERTWLDKPQG